MNSNKIIVLKFDESNTLNVLNINGFEDITIDDDITLSRLIIRNVKNIDSSNYLAKNTFRINSKKYEPTNNDFIIDIEKSIFEQNVDTSLLPINCNLNFIYTFSFDEYDTTNNFVPFVIDASLNLFKKNKLETSFDVQLYIDTCILNYYKFFDKNAQIINSKMESFMLLRTNPKLTGNIKLVVSEDYNLYLDTFSVSSTSALNKSQYKHIPISSDGNYPHDVYKAFRTLPQGEIYSVYLDSYDPHKIYKDLNLQIENIYEYGAEYNSNALYSENMKILAPLYIGKHLPTFFAIFKTNRLITKDYMAYNSDIFKDMLKSSEVIKIFDLRNSTTIGKYLNNYSEQIIKYLSGSCYLLFIELDNDKTSDNYRQGKNTWKGISIDKGILTEKTETSYFATLTLEGSNPLENYNMFILNGFSRNNLLFPNIINLEFMFNDIDADDFLLYNYFGLYLTENDFITFNLITKKYIDNNILIEYYNENNNLVALNDTPIDIIENENYNDRIFFATTHNAAKNLSNKKDLSDFIKSNVINNPYQNIIQLPVEEISFSDYASFITMKFTNNINYGEHFKFIIQNEKTLKKIVYDIIASNDENLKESQNNINQYVLSNNVEYFDISTGTNEFVNNIEYYRINFYTLDIYNYGTTANLSYQIKRLVACISKINSTKLVCTNYTENSISIMSIADNIKLLHILSNTVTTDTYIEDYIKFFSKDGIINAYLCSSFVDDYDLDKEYSNYGLEMIEKRYSSIVSFMKTSAFDNYRIYQVDRNLYNDLKDIKYPLISTINGYYPIVKFAYEYANNIEIETINNAYIYRFTQNYVNCINSPYDVSKTLILSYYEIKDLNNTINICSPCKANIAIMGINNIKDIDMYVNDVLYTNIYTDTTASFTANELVYLNYNDVRLHRFITYEIVKGYIKGLTYGEGTKFIITTDRIIYANSKGNISSLALSNDYIVFSEDTIIKLANESIFEQYNYVIEKPCLLSNNYYIDNTNTATSKLNIPFVPLVNCQWESNGLYFDGMQLLNINNINNSYNINGNFIENLYTPSGISNNRYIANKLSDKVLYNNKIITIKDFILSCNYKGAIKKFIAKNFNINSTIGYYNSYILTLEFIFYGIKFSIKLSNAQYANDIKLNEYNNYEIFVINDYDGSGKNEMYISKQEEFILLVNHIYGYNEKYSSNNVKSIIENAGINDSKYKWFDAPYNYLFSTTANFNHNVFLNKSKNQLLNEYGSYAIEIDLDIYDKNCASLGEFPHYTYIKLDDLFESKKDYDILKAIDTSYIDISCNKKITEYYNIFTENRDYNIKTIDSSTTNFKEIYNGTLRANTTPTYMFNMNLRNLKKEDNRTSESISLYNDLNDFTKKYTYIIKNYNDFYDSNENNIEKINDYKNSFIDKNLVMYIIDNVELNYQKIEINDNYKPVTLALTTPNKIKYNYGLFNPYFYDIFNFNTNDNIGEKISMDMLLANTLINSIESIKNYVYNKIANINAQYTYNYFIEDYHSPLSTDWDNNIYRLYKNDTQYSMLSGYSIGYTDKMLFGSKCINIHNKYLNIENWTAETLQTKYQITKQNVRSKAKQCLVIKLNITKAFYNLLKNNTNLHNNWLNVNSSNEIETYINNYITNTLVKYYDFTNIVLTLYEKLTNTNTNIANIIYNLPTNINEYDICTGAQTKLYEQGNEKILEITINDYENHDYYANIKINKI